MEVEFSFGHIQLEMPMRFNRHLDTLHLEL